MTKTTTMSREEFESKFIPPPDKKVGWVVWKNNVGLTMSNKQALNEMWSDFQSLLTSRDNEWRERIRGCIECDVDVLHVSLEKISDLLEQMEDKK